VPVTFSVPGQPVPQPRARVTVRAGKPKGYVPSKHPIHAYRAAIAAAAKSAGATPTTAAPLTLIISWIFVRPKSHYLANGKLNPRTALPTPPGDSSNYLKGVEDALNGIAWNDDVQVGRHVLEKAYGKEARTIVTVT
jgi:Holliday junction resolvase RusA-like endonuclease